MPLPRCLRALVFAALIPAALVAAAESARPKVLFIMADDNRPEHSESGSPAVTPNTVRFPRVAHQASAGTR